MKRLFLPLLLLMSVFTNLQAENRGYIVTKDGLQLTGAIGEIFYSDIMSTVVFINDFGTPYRLYPQLISGFVFQEDTEKVQYESKYKDGSWCFLRVIARGKILSLYKAHEEKTEFSDADNSFLGRRTYKVNELWLQYRKEKPVQLNRFNFRRTMRKKLWLYPSIAKKIGKPEYRYKNVDKIVREVNSLSKRTIL